MTMIEPNLPEQELRYYEAAAEQRYRAMTGMDLPLEERAKRAHEHAESTPVTLDPRWHAPKHRADVEPEEGPVAQCCGQCICCPTCGEAVRA